MIPSIVFFFLSLIIIRGRNERATASSVRRIIIRIFPNFWIINARKTNRRLQDNIIMVALRCELPRARRLWCM
jgi:hypothetical protein